MSLIKSGTTKIIRSFFLLLTFFSMLTACSEGDPTALYESLIVEFNDVQSISLSSVNTVITTGDSLQLTVTGTNSQAGTVDLTEYVSWSVSDDNLARIKSGGVLESFSTDGIVTVTASLSNFSDTLDITLSSASLSTIEIKADTLTPDTLSTSVCRPLALKAFGTYDDASVRDITEKASWSTATAAARLKTTPSVSLSYYQTPSASVSAELDGINSGAIDIMITDDIIDMVLSPLAITLSTGSTQTFKVLADYVAETGIDISSTAHWQSSDTTKATFSNNNEVLTGVAEGTTTITASCGSQQASTLVTVEGRTLDRIEISPDITNDLVTMSVNSSFQLSAFAYYSDGSDEDITNDVTWTAVHPTTEVVVNVSNIEPTKGLVTSNNIVDLDYVDADYAGKTDRITIKVIQ